MISSRKRSVSVRERGRTMGFYKRVKSSLARALRLSAPDETPESPGTLTRKMAARIPMEMVTSRLKRHVLHALRDEGPRVEIQSPQKDPEKTSSQSRALAVTGLSGSSYESMELVASAACASVTEVGFDTHSQTLGIRYESPGTEVYVEPRALARRRVRTNVERVPANKEILERLRSINEFAEDRDILILNNATAAIQSVFGREACVRHVNGTVYQLMMDAPPVARLSQMRRVVDCAPEHIENICVERVDGAWVLLTRVRGYSAPLESVWKRAF